MSMETQSCANCGGSYEYYQNHNIVPPCPRCGYPEFQKPKNEADRERYYQSWDITPRKENTMINASELAKTAGVLNDSEFPNVDSELQSMVGDPDDFRTSPFAQFKPNPGNMQLPNPLSPVEGDEMFFAYMIPGAKFQARDGSQWNILDYPWQGMVHIENVWYPRVNAQVNLNDIRRSIEQFVEPVQVFIAPPPVGVDYGAMPVKIVDGPTNYGRPDELSKGEMGMGNSDVSGGW